MALSTEQLVALDRAEQVYMLIAFFLESIVYGIYFILFIGAVHIMMQDRSRGDRVSKVFFFSMLAMFLLTTVYTAVNAYRFTRAYAQNVNFPAMPVKYFQNFTEWDNLSYILIVIVLVLHADALVIYRCFLIWGGNYWVIALPALLLLFSIGINAVAIMWFISGNKYIDHKVAFSFFSMIYPVNLTQNCLTTGLIAFKIWRQHRSSKKAGLKQSNGLHLITVARIIVESASIYTIQQAILLVLHQLGHRASVILHATMVPSIGIVFVLIAIRTHFARANEPWKPEFGTLLIPSYLHMDSPDMVHKIPPSSVGIHTTSTDCELGMVNLLPKTSDSSSEISDGEKSENSSITVREFVAPSPPPGYTV